MTRTIPLPERLTAGSMDDLALLLAPAIEAAEVDAIEIDGRQVRTIGALPAERLARFVAQTRRAGRAVTLVPSADMEGDLRVLGLADAVLGTGEAA